MAFKKEEMNGISVITLSGKILTHTAQELKNDFDQYCTQLNSATIVDLKDVSYISSYFIGVLLESYKKHHNQNCGFYLSSVDPHIQFVLKTAGLADSFKIYETKEEALHEIKSGFTT